MVRLVFILILFLVGGCAGSFSEFSSKDYSHQAVATVLTVADWNQTLQIVDSGRSEQNSFLGDKPADSKINTMIPLAIAGQWVVAWALPSEAVLFGFKYNPRRTFQVGVIVGEGWAVNHNIQAGINVKF